MHFSTLTIMVIVALDLIPPLVQGKPVRSNLIKIITFTMSLRLGWLLLTIGLMVTLLILAPNTLDQMLASAVASTAHFAGFSGELGFDDLTAFVVEASVLNIAQVFIITFILSGGLFLIASLLRRLLTWYSLPRAKKRLMKIAYGIIGVTAVFVGLTVLPLLTAILLNPAKLLKPANIGIGVLGIIVTAIGLLLFLKADKQYAKRCPVCNANVEGKYEMGKTCEACNELLQPWFIARYEI